ncbi:MAG: tyrosine-type recombinase/integrase [Eubacteriales bacterium]|nr:tyrosine-type recombinase/integrase [Eubacteriales bacterium]
MNIAQPIRNEQDLNHFKDYYRGIEPDVRNYLLITMGLNTALRISDILKLQWKHVYNGENRQFRSHITIVEMKTGKKSKIFLNANIKKALKEYEKEMNALEAEHYLFGSSVGENTPITRVQAYRIVKKAANFYRLEGVISCHSLRKTFGYYAWKQGVPPVLLMNIYNHSSFQVTKRYLGIEQDDRDLVFEKILI